MPTAPSSRLGPGQVVVAAVVPPAMAAAPAPTRAGVFGMARTTGVPAPRARLERGDRDAGGDRQDPPGPGLGERPARRRHVARLHRDDRAVGGAGTVGRPRRRAAGPRARRAASATASTTRRSAAASRRRASSPPTSASPMPPAPDRSAAPPSRRRYWRLRRASGPMPCAASGSTAPRLGRCSSPKRPTQLGDDDAASDDSTDARTSRRCRARRRRAPARERADGLTGPGRPDPDRDDRARAAPAAPRRRRRPAASG